MKHVFFIVWYAITLTLVAALMSKSTENTEWTNDYIFGFNEIDFDTSPVYTWDLELLDLTEGLQ